MNRTQILKGVPILALSIVLAACGRAVADEPSANPQPTDRPAPVEPSERPSADPSDRPSQEPVAPAPSQPVAPPSEPSAPAVVDPETVVVEHGVHFVARVIRDGVAVRNLPDLDSALVDGTNDGEGGIVAEIRLRTGDEVLVLVGPVFADGYSWYEVVAGGRGPAYYFRGWVAGEFIEHVSDAPEFNAVAWVDGQGFSASSSGHVPEFAPLVVAHGVTPMPGDASCTFELYLIGTDGQRIVLVPTQTVTDARIGQAAAGNLPELYMDAGGSIEIGANTDCSFAAAVNIPQG